MKYFFFDIDGTLTNIHTGKVVPSAVESIRQLQKNGHFVAIATGRAHYKSLAIAEEAGIHNLVTNGGAALTIDDQMVCNIPLDKKKALMIIHEAEEKGFGVLVAFEDSIKVFMKNHLFIDQVGERKEPTEYIYKPDMNYEDLENIYKIYISVSTEQEYKLVHRDLLTNLRFIPDYLTYQHDQKDKGIRDMMDYLHADYKDIVVFGDAENDMVMFQKEWTSIAMGNGYLPLLQKADYVTDAAEDDGIFHACLHFGWI